MSPSADAFLRSWPSAPWLFASLLLSAAIYGRGWMALHRRDPRRWGGGKLAAFLGGLAALFLAFGSPIEPFGSLLLQVHMVQHMLLMMAAPPLLWLGAPLFPMIRGLPRPIRVYWVAPVLRLSGPSGAPSPGSRNRPRRAGPLPRGLLVVAHPGGLRGRAPILRAASAPALLLPRGVAPLLVSRRPALPRPAPMVPLAARAVPADRRRLEHRPFGPADLLRPGHLPPLRPDPPGLGDLPRRMTQSTAGVIMWVPGSVAFLFPLFGIGLRLLSGGGQPVRAVPKGRAGDRLPVLPMWDAPPPRRAFDLLDLPIVGRFLRWRHARISIQLVSTGLAGVVIADGLLGTQVAAMNLAGVLPWIHWRGFVILGLLAVGNVSCMACPLRPRRPGPWPALDGYPAPPPSGPDGSRSKWLEGRGPGRPLLLVLRGVLALGQPAGDGSGSSSAISSVAFAIDGLFRGKSFCKYLCPIGQFDFVQSSRPRRWR